MSSQVCHFRYCRVVSPVEHHSFNFGGESYQLHFVGPDFETRYGMSVERPAAKFEHVDAKLLLWLLVYFGEDTLAPFQEVDTSRIWERGDFSFDPDQFDRFVAACERIPRASMPRWRTRLFERAVIYLSMAVRTGVWLVPVNLGFFGMCLECIGNVHHGRRDQYFKLGQKRFMGVLHNRLARYKKQEKSRASAKRFQKLVVEDVELLHELRNAFYGHSLLHLSSDRAQLARALRKWYGRQVKSKRFVKLSFRVHNLEAGVVNAGPALYKLGLRLCRIFIWMMLGFAKPPPFASHDFSVLGDLRVGEPLRSPSRPRSAKFGEASLAVEDSDTETAVPPSVRSGQASKPTEQL